MHDNAGPPRTWFCALRLTNVDMFFVVVQVPLQAPHVSLRRPDQDARQTATKSDCIAIVFKQQQQQRSACEREV
jgi:hypothetical protein